MEGTWIGTKEVSEILGVSESTVRRLGDKGALKCHIIPYNNYRKFNLSDVINFKSAQMDSKSKPSQLHFNLDDNKKSLLNIKAQSHPSHYLMHKYWGRKSHNVISSYIENYSNPGERVLDPFAGSGITPIEAIKKNRIGIGIDINPMSKFIAENTVSEVNLDLFNETATNILDYISEKFAHLYQTSCSICDSKSMMVTSVWDQGKLSRVRGKCPTHGIFIKDADEFDLKAYLDAKAERESLDLKGELKYPKNELLKYVRRSGNKNINDLFNDRALLILSFLKKEIDKVEDSSLKSLLLFTFTSMLANVSNMLPGDLEKGNYKSGWVISKFWTPKIHTERNIFSCFELRKKAILKGKRELQGIKDYLLKYYIQDSSKLNNIEDSSIDYILTDPPYGESIAYLGLSQFWNSWIFDDVDYNNEIIIDNYRQKDYTDYSERMTNTFNELYRVLKPGRYLSFTFHNRDLSVWKSVMDAVKNANFILRNIALQDQAVNSGTQGLNKTNTLTGDFVYTLQKDEFSNKSKKVQSIKHDNNLAFVENQISNIVTTKTTITPTKLYEILLPIIIENEAYTHNGKAIDIEKILKNNYDYLPTTNEEQIRLGEHFVWKVRN